MNAPCLITIGGTSGEVLITYTLNGNINRLTASFGTSQYINDGATNVSSQTISGDAVASSACLTINSLVSNCYLYHWESIGNSNQEVNDMVFDALDFAGAITNLIQSPYTDGNGYLTLASHITDLQDGRIKILSGKKEITARGSINNYMTVKITGTIIPLIRIKNPLFLHYLYLKAEVLPNCAVPLNYEQFNNCVAPVTAPLN